MTSPPVALPAEMFPFTVELIDAGTREIVWAVTICGPDIIRVPGLDETGPGLKTARVTYADGTVEEV